ncbi:MAG: nucleoside kinase [Bacteroidales bacterium]|nr:nucleoside kinase [Bacteroidales bacterium]MBQ4026269.1 nucleoside kinase [Bacteroidales bacterium]
MLKIYCKNTGTSLEFQEGTTLAEMLPRFDFERPYDVLCAKVNNVTQGLKYRAFNNRDVEFLDYRSYAGRSAYCRSLCFLLSKATRDVFPDSKLKMRRPISKGYFCTLQKGSPVTSEDVELIRCRMREIVKGDAPFKRVEVRTEDAIELFRSMGYSDKVKLLETSGQTYIRYHTLEGTPDYYYDALVPSAGFLKVWDLSQYQDGMLLRVPDRHAPEKLTVFEPQPKTYEVFRESLRWNAIMNLDNVGDVNHACLKGHAGELIQVAEALQEKKVVQIAEEIERRYRCGALRLVLITGPSSSGKTTITKRLSTQLLACGLRPQSVSTDDYFVNRLDTPRFPDGSFDFDNFDTVDHEAMQNDLVRLINGEEVQVPEYNFVTGLREYNGKTLKLEPGSILLVEGIHALNPALTELIPDNAKFRIFINTIVSISLDDHNCIPTSDNRLLRRIVRDYNKGAFSARETISNWPNVRRAEVKWIYPFQESADVLFNSAYLVEFAVIRLHAEQILATVPRNCPEYSEANRLLKFLSYFTPVSDREIPPTSLLREFVGGSSFKY